MTETAEDTTAVTAEAATTDPLPRLAVAGAEPRPVPAAAAGNPRAVGRELGRFFTAHGRMVFALCNVLLRNREEAEDATQQCFLSAQRSMLAGVVPADPSAWLATIARNECLTRLRRRHPDTVALRDDDLFREDDVADIVDRRAEIAALSEAIAGLPAAQRQAVVLRDFYGLSYREVSVALGVTGPAVESLLFKSRKRLQSRLRPFRAAGGIAAVPASVRDALMRAIPGFSSGLPKAGLGVAGLSAKLLSAPTAAALTVVALAAGVGAIAFAYDPGQRTERTSSPLRVSVFAPGPDLPIVPPLHDSPAVHATQLFTPPTYPKAERHTAASTSVPASAPRTVSTSAPASTSTPAPVVAAPQPRPAPAPVARVPIPSVAGSRTVEPEQSREPAPPLPEQPTAPTPPAIEQAPVGERHDDGTGAGGGSFPAPSAPVTAPAPQTDIIDAETAPATTTTTTTTATITTPQNTTTTNQDPVEHGGDGRDPSSGDAHHDGRGGGGD
jgi:RNA polymerase sigma-70 factor (ECF subfamily)